MTRWVQYNADFNGPTGPSVADKSTGYGRRWARKSAGPYKKDQSVVTENGIHDTKDVYLPDNKDCKDLEAFVEVLRAHCNDDSLIKGWEADRRICVGRDRAALRAAAKDVRQKAFKTGRIASAKANVSKRLSRQEWLYVEALQWLHMEMAKAQESDFDCMLKDGLDWLEEHLGFKAKNLKCVTASVYDRVGRDLLRRLKEQRASGHRGKAIDRDLRHATVLHGELCKAWALVDDSEESQLAYLGAAEAFMVELAKAGEPDFDGKLRQAINYLEHGGERLCF